MLIELCPLVAQGCLRTAPRPRPLRAQGGHSLTDVRVREFLLRVDVLPWDHEVTKTYADLRAVCEAKGVTLSPLDMMIAAHAAATNATLVTRDKAFSRVPSPLRIEDWAEMS